MLYQVYANNTKVLLQTTPRGAPVFIEIKASGGVWITSEEENSTQ
jgi:hypothetical protein